MAHATTRLFFRALRPFCNDKRSEEALLYTMCLRRLNLPVNKHSGYAAGDALRAFVTAKLQ
jgi:hypothetical protein